MARRTKIYFAGPLFTQAEWQWNLAVAEALRKLDFDVFLPQSRAEPMLLGSESFDPKRLFLANLEEIDRTDLLLAIFDQPDPDSGTCWECGYAYKAGIPIIGLRTDLRAAGDEPGRPVNLMLSQSSKEFFLLPLERREDLKFVATELARLIRNITSDSV